MICKPVSLAAIAAATLALTACDNGGAIDAQALEGEPVAAIEAPEGTQWADMVTVSNEDGYILGNPDAPIKLVEYASLTCPACAQFAAQAAEPLKADYVNTGRVSFELRNQIHGPQDLILARLVRCSSKESFHPLSDQVWANQQAVLGPLYDNPGPFEQAMQLPEGERFAAAAQAAGFMTSLPRAVLARNRRAPVWQISLQWKR